jgi:hypothetical protein
MNRRLAPLVALAFVFLTTTASMGAETVDLLSLEEVKTASNSPGIINISNTEIVDDPENPGRKMLKMGGGKGSPVVSFANLEELAADFQVRFEVQLTTGYFSCGLRNQNGARAIMMSAGMSGGGHIGINFSGGEEDPSKNQLASGMKIAAGEPGNFVISVSPANKTMQVEVNGKTSAKLAFPDGFDQVFSISFSYTNNLGYEEPAFIRKVELTRGAGTAD